MALPDAPDDLPVTHNETEKRFETLVQGQLAVCDYQLQGERMVFTHTYVPGELRGRGVAQKLVRTALEHARGTNLKVVPVCSYVAAFIERAREYQPLLAGSAQAGTAAERGPAKDFSGNCEDRA